MSVDLSTNRLGARADDIYSALIDACAGLTESEVAAFQARLILLLANLTGDPEAVLAAIKASRATAEAPAG